jgi:hypothetical protein
MAGPLSVARDVLAIDDLPDPERVGAGEDNAVRALARRLLQPPDANAEIGDLVPIETIDLRDYLGDTPTTQELRDLEAVVERCIADDERVREVESVSAVHGGNRLQVSVSGLGSEGPFSFVLSVDDVSVALLVGEQDG